MTDHEILEQILQKMNEIDMTKLEKSQKEIFNKLDVVEFKTDMSREKLDNLSLDVKWTEREIKKDIKHLQDTTETLVIVLQGKGILPKAQ